MKKQIFNTSIIMFVMLVILTAWYGVGSFYYYDTNPANWTKAGRFIICLFGGLSSILAAFITGILINEEED